MKYVPAGPGGLNKLGGILVIIILAGWAAQVILDVIRPLIPFITACVVAFILFKVVWSSFRRW